MSCCSATAPAALRIDSLVTDLPPSRESATTARCLFRFGGDLRLSGDSDGAFRGTIDIVVDYL